MSRVPLLFLISIALGPAQITYERLLKAGPDNWLTYSGSYNSQRHSALKQVHSGNVGSLTPKWIYHFRGEEQLESVPIVVDGVMYVSDSNRIVALDGRAGRVIWEYRRRPELHRGPNRGVAVFGNKVYFGTQEAHLVAVDARTGSLVWDAKMAEVNEGYWSPAAPLAVNGKIIAGIAAGDYGLNGWLDAFDAESGRH